jgi:hypothetical protein
MYSGECTMLVFVCVWLDIHPIIYIFLNIHFLVEHLKWKTIILLLKDFSLSIINMFFGSLMQSHDIEHT